MDDDERFPYLFPCLQQVDLNFFYLSPPTSFHPLLHEVTTRYQAESRNNAGYEQKAGINRKRVREGVGERKWNQVGEEKKSKSRKSESEWLEKESDLGSSLMRKERRKSFHLSPCCLPLFPVNSSIALVASFPSSPLMPFHM